jgi:hypothetical protein
MAFLNEKITLPDGLKYQSKDQLTSDLAPLRTNLGNLKRYAIRLPDFC